MLLLSTVKEIGKVQLVVKMVAMTQQQLEEQFVSLWGADAFAEDLVNVLRLKGGLKAQTVLL